MGDHDNWDEHWDRYAEAAKRNPAQQMRHKIISKLLPDRCQPEGMKVLDIGSGQGDLCVRLNRDYPTASLVGFELSERGVEVSREKVSTGKFYVVDVFHPTEEARQFEDWANHAICSEVLEHVDFPVEFLRSARSYLADGCRLVVTVPGGPMSAFDAHIGHRQHFTRASITEVLSKSGFSVERVYLAGFPFFNLYRMAVILRGDKLENDVSSSGTGGGGLAYLAMAFFRGLFKANLINSPFGWQVVAVARKKV